MSDTADPFAPGAIVAGRFRLDARIGEGGMAVVWAATHLVTRKPLALKILKRVEGKDAPMRLRFVREARAACAVRHPNVVSVHDVLELDDGVPMLVMDLLEGETLGRRVDREGRLSMADVAQVMLPVVSAVGAAHALGIIHRDLKPDNIFLVRSAEGRTDVKVLDFGIAKLTALEGDAALSGAMTGTGALLGTPYYMSPEQIFGERDIDLRSDVWAVGVILYELISGRRPTQAESIGQVLKLITRGGIIPLREVAVTTPPDVADLVERMLAREKALRPTDLREAQIILRRYADGSAASSPEPTIPSGKPRVVGSEPQISRLATTRNSDADVPTLDATVADPAYRPSSGALSPGSTKVDTIEPPRVRPRRRSSRVVVLSAALAAMGAAVVIVLAGRAALTPAAAPAPTIFSSGAPKPVDPLPPTTAAAAAEPTASVAVVASGAQANVDVDAGGVAPSFGSPAPTHVPTSIGKRPLARGAASSTVSVVPSGSAHVPSVTGAPSTRASGGVIETAPF